MALLLVYVWNAYLPVALTFIMLYYDTCTHVIMSRFYWQDIYIYIGCYDFGSQQNTLPVKYSFSGKLTKMLDVEFVCGLLITLSNRQFPTFPSMWGYGYPKQRQISNSDHSLSISKWTNTWLHEEHVWKSIKYNNKVHMLKHHQQPLYMIFTLYK